MRNFKKFLWPAVIVIVGTICYAGIKAKQDFDVHVGGFMGAGGERSSQDYALQDAAMQSGAGTMKSTDYQITLGLPCVDNVPVLSHSPLEDTNGYGVRAVRAHITDDAGISSATLHYSFGDSLSFTNIPMGLISGTYTDGDWEANIPEVLQDTTVYYYLVASDGVNPEIRSPNISFYSYKIDTTPPHISNGTTYSIYGEESRYINVSDSVTIKVDITDFNGVGIEQASAEIVEFTPPNTYEPVDTILLYDDRDNAHGDDVPGDGNFANKWGVGNAPRRVFFVHVTPIDSVENSTTYNLLYPTTDAAFVVKKPFGTYNNVLIVIDYEEPDADMIANCYKDAVDDSCDVWEVYWQGPIDTTILDKYAGSASKDGIQKGVIWCMPYSGHKYGVRNTDVQSTLIKYLESSGRLFITGQDIGREIADSSGYNPLLTDYLKVRYAGDANWDSLQGVGEMAGIGANLNGGDAISEQLLKDIIQPTAKGVSTVMTYEIGKGKAKSLIAGAGINIGSSDTTVYKAIYFGFGFEGINNSQSREIVMKGVRTLLDMGSLIAPQVMVISPDSGEIWISGTQKTITWYASDDDSVDHIDIFLSYNSGASCSDTIATNQVNDSTFEWTTKDTFCTACRIKVVAYDNDGYEGEDVSNYDFVVSPGVKGDINCDGEVNILDIMKAINIIHEAYIPTPYEFWAADVKENGNINICDIIAMVNIIQSKKKGKFVTRDVLPIRNNQVDAWKLHSWPKRVAKCLVSSNIVLQKLDNSKNRFESSLHTSLIQDTSVVSIPQVSGEPGSDSNIVHINLENEIPVAGVQVLLTYDTLLIAREAIITTRAQNLTISSSIKPGRIQILLYSMALDTIKPGSGPIIEIPFYVSPNAPVEDSTLLHFDKVILSDKKGNELPSDDVDGWFYFSEIGVEEDISLPRKYSLSQSYPNPALSHTHIKYALPKATHVALKIYDISGKLVRMLINERQKPGYYLKIWDGKDYLGRKVVAGVYFIKFTTGDFKQIKKMIFIQ